MQTMRQIGLALLLAVVAAGCVQVTGEKGEARFSVGNGWQPATPIALGSVFSVSAETNDLLRKPLTVSSDNPAVFQAESAGNFRAAGEGQGLFLAKDGEALVDQVTYSVAKASVARLHYWADRILKPDATLPDQFAIAAGSNLTVRVDLVAGQQALNHRQLATLAAVDKSIVTTSTSDGVDVQMNAGAQGGTQVTLGAGQGLQRSYGVSVLPTAQVADFELAYLPIQLDLALVNKSKPDQPPGEGEAPQQQADQVHFAILQAKTADGLRMFGAKGKWTVVDGQVELTFTQASEVQYFQLKAGQKATLQVELNGKTKTLVVEG